MWDGQDWQLVIFKTEAVLSLQQITQPVAITQAVTVSKQIKIPKHKTVCVMGTIPPISNRVVPRGPVSALLVTLNVSQRLYSAQAF